MLDTIVAVFDFLYSILDIIIQGIKGITSLIYNVVMLFNNVVKVLPTPLYVASISFIGVFTSIFIFKLINK